MPSFYHLRQNSIAPFRTTLRETNRIVVTGILAHSYQSSGLTHGEFLRLLAKISLRGCLYSYCIMKEIEIIEIKSDYLLLRIIAFQFQGNNPFNRLLQHTFLDRASFLRIQLLCQLLGKSTATSCTFLTKEATLDDSTHKSSKIDTGMFIETYVLCGNQGIHQIGRQFFIRHENSVGTTITPSSHRLSIGRDNLAGKLVNRILKLLDIGHIAYIANEYLVKGKRQSTYYQKKEYPKSKYKFLSHKCLFLDSHYIYS